VGLNADVADVLWEGVTVIRGIKTDKSEKQSWIKDVESCFQRPVLFISLSLLFSLITVASLPFQGAVINVAYRHEGDGMSFVSVLETIGKGFEKGLKWAVKYSVPVERLVGLLFPAAAPVANEVADATSLIQTAVLLVEQKYAASGVQSGTGTQKLAEVMLLTEQAVTALLTKAGIATSTPYLQSVVSAVVAILNVQQTQSPAAVAGAAA
jgi:hypothetical protein